MNILGKKQNQGAFEEEKTYNLPAVLRQDDKEIPLGKALIISTIAHPGIVLLIWLFIIILALLGINLMLFQKPEPKVRDIEFVLVNKPEEKPLNPNTKYRSDRNSRAGGKHDPNKPVSEPEPQAARSVPQTQSIAPKPRVIRRPAPQPQKQAERQEPAPPRPTPRASYPKPSVTPPNRFSIPMPTAKMPRSASPSGGPVTSAPLGSSSPSSSPSPVMSPGSSGSPGRGRYTSGYSPGGGNIGNPGPGNPNGRPGIDAIKEPDFGPYMRELQRRIKRNWDPPRGDESKRVILLFKVARDGRLNSGVRVLRSSGSEEADKAAVSAVELSAPFRPLPPEYRGNDIDIQFTFDYNVFSVRRY